ncbi:MAG: SAM-dependent methyltransferase, partial [Rickettsiales bacterium]|nr:SAM-dependent methyltransferase [Rickettsiales bacterium]
DGFIVPTANQLFAKEYYMRTLYRENPIDKNEIYSLTKKINDNLHFNFGIKNLAHRMVFTACALVAKRYNDNALMIGMDWHPLHQSIYNTLTKSIQDAKKVNDKLGVVLESFAVIKNNLVPNQDNLDDFITCVGEISKNIYSDFWNGEDVMAIFFNEFTRYKGKSEQGQVFTPDHITSLMYRITGTSYKDNVLDACCGSGAFLVKAMSNMINEVGGIANIDEVKKIHNERLFGIEFDKEIYALACANMMIHKDGKTNLDDGDSRTVETGKWIKSKKITKVLMNPPYENKYGCLKIVENVLDNVEYGAICAFLLPDNKLEVGKNTTKKWLNRHTLQKIIKLPDGLFPGTSASCFIFKAHESQNEKEIFACWLKDDGHEVVKNQGRHDVKGKWESIENHWVDIIYKQSGDDSIQWIKPTEPLAYKLPEKELVLRESDFEDVVMDYFIFENQLGGVLKRLTLGLLKDSYSEKSEKEKNND